MSDIPSNQRIRENKRRYRARKKEYVEEIERKLRDQQQQGIKTAQEIQIAALRVVEQNIRLKELLRHVGVDDCTIQAWLQGQPRECSLVVAKTQSEDCQNNDIRVDLPEAPRCSPEQLTKDSTSHPPCKMMTILAENPRIDITQILSTHPEDQNLEATNDGVECSKAYEMCVRLATSDEAIESIARSLENGCIKNANSKGCCVKNDVVWELIDKLSL